MNDEVAQDGEEDDANQADDLDDQESNYSESSDEDVDANVQLDMERLQDCFPGFRSKYRLIKRIGEGMLWSEFPEVPRF